MHISIPIIVLSALMLLLWIVQYYKKEADIVDAGWTAGLAFMAVYYAIVLEGDLVRRMLAGVLTFAWATRLALYLIVDRVLRPGEDGRYQELRNKWGSKAQFKFFLFFQAQGVSVIIISLPLFVLASNASPSLQLWDYIAVLLFCISITGESIADRQLAAFRAESGNKGLVCKKGLWFYSRHPNYFFEWLHWWSYVFFSVNSPYFAWSLVGPLIMYILIVKITGIPPAEARCLQNRGPAYREYQLSTNAFFPWLPKKI